MSMNVRCYLLVDGTRVEIPLVQTLTVDSWPIVYAAGPAGAKRPWQESARAYLATVARYNQPPPPPRRGTDHHRSQSEAAARREVVRRERRSIGRAWRAAEDRGGRLDFTVA